MKKLIYSRKLKEIEVPEHWHELTAKQFIAVAAILHSDESAEIKLDRMLYAVCNKSLYAFLRIPFEIRMRCYEHIAWLFEQRDLTKQLIPVYKGFYGPESDFDNMVLSEFHHSEAAYQQFATTGDSEALTELCAVLYRLPKDNYDKTLNKEGDIRRTFNFGELSYNKSKIARWPLPVKQAILLWYDGCRQNLAKLYPTAFANQNSSNTDAGNGLYKMIRSLAGEKYGTFNQVEALALHIAMMEIVSSIEEEKELKSKYNI